MTDRLYFSYNLSTAERAGDGNMTQQQIDEKYPLWKCEERPYHIWKAEEKYGLSAKIQATWGTTVNDYLFSVSIEDAKKTCERLDSYSVEWKPKFNTIGALIN